LNKKAKIGDDGIISEKQNKIKQNKIKQNKIKQKQTTVLAISK